MCVCGTHSRWSRSGWFCSSSWARGRPGLSAAAGGGAEGPWRSDVCWDASRIRSSSRGLRPEPPCNRREKSWLNETLLCVHTFILRFARSLARSRCTIADLKYGLAQTHTHSISKTLTKTFAPDNSLTEWIVPGFRIVFISKSFLENVLKDSKLEGSGNDEAPVLLHTRLCTLSQPNISEIKYLHEQFALRKAHLKEH